MRYAFSVLDFKGCEAFISLSKEYKFPIILQVSQKVAKISDVGLWADVFNELKKNYKADVSLSLDHATNKKLIMACIEAGWDMVMFDGGGLDYKSNLQLTKELVRCAHRNSVLVEAEFGIIGNKKDERYIAETGMSLLQKFVENTKVDFLALPFGTKHGLGRDFSINYDLIEKVHKLIDIPLVLHGGSGLSRNMISRCIETGIYKINISTEVKKAYFNAYKRYRIQNFENYIQEIDGFDVLLKSEIRKLFLKKLRFLE